MVSRPRSSSTALFKIVAVGLIAGNVIVHGTIALFLSGPFGLGLFLSAVVTVWVWSWIALRRFREASERGRPDPTRRNDPEAVDRDVAGTGVG